MLYPPVTFFNSSPGYAIKKVQQHQEGTDLNGIKSDTWLCLHINLVGNNINIIRILEKFPTDQ
jgi:hypothetical protein